MDQMELIRQRHSVRRYLDKPLAEDVRNKLEAFTAMCNRECIGIVTQAESPGGNPERAERWLKLAGCKNIFFVDSVKGKGVRELLDYLNRE